MSSAAGESLDLQQPGDPGARPRRIGRPDLSFALRTVLVLLAVGAVLGWPWQLWAPRTVALVYSSAGLVPDETEAYVGGDGRFVLVTGIVGLLAGTVVWVRRTRRGPVAAIGLAAGSAGGAWLTAQVGRLTGGGTVTGQVGTVIRPPVQLHATNLLVIEPLAALLVYLLCALFATQDDLGRSAEPQLGADMRRSD